MATIQKFEDLLMWQKARLLTQAIYKNLNIETFKYLNELATECSRLISSFIQKLKTSNVQGLQYKREIRKGMSETNRKILETSPELKEYYNVERDEIEFWRLARDRQEKKNI